LAAAREAREGQVDVASSLLARQVDGRHRQGGTDAVAACLLVDYDILDPRPQTRRQREGDEGEHADDGALVAGDEQRVGLMVDDPGKLVGVKRRRCAGQLWEEAPAGLDEFVGHLADGFDLDAHEGGLYLIPRRMK